MTSKSERGSDLMAEATREREVVDSRKAQALQEKIVKAVNTYSEFLDRHELIWEFNADGPPKMKAQALVVTLDYSKSDEIEIALKDGALDRVYGDGTNPDPQGLGPPDIPQRREDD